MDLPITTPVGAPVEGTALTPAPPSLFAATVHARVKKHGNFFLFFGVILPLLALLFETTTHFCAQHFFDPFPSPSHILLYLLIPASNFATWLAGRRDLSAFYLPISLANGMALGIGCLYTLMFLPISGMSALYIAFCGFGLLGLAPLLSLPCSWLAGKSVCGLSSQKSTFFDPHQVEHIGHLIVLVMVVALELPSTLTRMNLSAAAEPATAASAVSWLRKYGSQEVMLRACYERSGRATDILGSLYEHAHPLSVEQARATFYRVTGKPFNTVPIPASARATITNANISSDPSDLNAGVQDEFDYDSDIAGESVSGMARGLSVSAASITGTLDGDAAVANIKWSCTFDNTSPYDREARCKLILPPGAVVTRATLTVDGVQHDATIMVREEARAVYQAAVKERKNPLLVSLCGPDQILAQCYPIRHGKDISLSFDIACPLNVATDLKSASLMLPAFAEKNFQFDKPLLVNLTGASSMSGITPGLTDSQAAGGHQLTGNVEPGRLARFQSVVTVARDPALTSVIRGDGISENANIVRAIAPESYASPRKLTVLIDGSEAMKAYLPEIAEGLQFMPAKIPGVDAPRNVEIRYISDKTQMLCEPGSVPGDTKFVEAINRLRTVPALGGQDNAELVSALRKIADDREAAILWIHGAQPGTISSGGTVRDVIASNRLQPQLYDLQISAGPNDYLNFSEFRPALVRVVRTGTLSADLRRLFSAWERSANKNNAALTVGFERKDLEAGGVQPAGDKTLSQLWAHQEILRKSGSQYRNQRDEAGMLANQYHLVTPVSSAVVTVDIPQLAGSIEAPKKVGMVDELFNLATSQLSSLSASLSASKDAALMSGAPQPASVENGRSGLVGAPVDPRYGQSNEAGTAAPELQGATNGTVSGYQTSRSSDVSSFKEEVVELKSQNAKQLDAPTAAPSSVQLENDLLSAFGGNRSLDEKGSGARNYNIGQDGRATNDGDSGGTVMSDTRFRGNRFQFAPNIYGRDSQTTAGVQDKNLSKTDLVLEDMPASSSSSAKRGHVKAGGYLDGILFIVLFPVLVAIGALVATLARNARRTPQPQPWVHDKTQPTDKRVPTNRVAYKQPNRSKQ